jgi:regulator of protease activity HflC (stomatin/prohibitin superfamily)
MKGIVILELLGFGIWLLLRKAPQAAGQAPRRGLRVLGLVLVIAGVLLPRMWITVPAASVAAMYDPLAGGIQPYDILEGWALVPPWATVRYFSVRTQNYTMGGTAQEGTGVRDDAIVCQTNEGLSLGIDATVLFQIAPGDAHKLWKAVGPNYISVIVRPQVREATRIIISEYPIMSVYSNAPPDTGGVANVDFYPGKRQEVEDKIFQRLQAHLADKGISLQRFLLRNVDYMQKEFETAVVAKQVAQQNIVTQSYEAEVQRIRAQANIVRAEGDSEAIRLKANALRINRAVIKWEFIQKMPDDMDVVILPDRVMPLIDLGTSGSAPSNPPSGGRR